MLLPMHPVHLFLSFCMISYVKNAFSVTENAFFSVLNHNFNHINYCLYAHRANGGDVGAHLCVRPFYRFRKTVGADIIRLLLNGTGVKTLPAKPSVLPTPLSGEASKLNNNLPFKNEVKI